MAGYQAIAATSQAILGLLANACPASDFPSLDFRLFQAGTFASNPITQGVSLYLYNVIPSAVRRNLPPLRRSDGRVLRPSLPIDVYYLLTAWASDAVQQQRILGWAMRVIHDHPLLPSDLLNAAGPEPSIFQDDETVEINLQTLPLTDLDLIWKVADNRPQPSAICVARMLTIESAFSVEEAAEVQIRDLRFGHLVTS